MKSGIEAALKALAERVVSCERCPRLRAYCEEVARVKKRAYKDWTYWGRPLPGFGDPYARLLVVGLAPAAHGGNRTGRMFTGDGSGDWLIKALYEAGFANQPLSVNREDGLKLKAAYITAAVRCAPPRNKPTRQEIENCSPYLAEELKLLREVKVVLTLGRVAFDTYLSHLPEGLAEPRPSFKHGAVYQTGSEAPTLAASYHPSRQNTQTGKLTWQAWRSIFTEIRKILG
ncbi:MAG: uracil-DNA glycosylase [Candidatus Bathyarchaeia archaeon]